MKYIKTYTLPYNEIKKIVWNSLHDKFGKATFSNDVVSCFTYPITEYEASVFSDMLRLHIAKNIECNAIYEIKE